jgi:hypothetical protein
MMWKPGFRMPRRAVYFTYVIINLALFTIKTPERWQSPALVLVYVTVALGRFMGFRNSDNAPQGALELIRDMSLFRRRTDRMLKGLGSSNPLLSANESLRTGTRWWHCVP